MKFKCPVCGEVFEGRKERCPYCNSKFRYPNQNVTPLAVVVKSTPRPEPEPEQMEVDEFGRLTKVEAPVKQESKKAETKQASTVNPEDESYFDGYTIQLIGLSLLGFLLTVVTLGICFPLAYGNILRWEAKHTVVNGYRLTFNGSPGSLIPRWLLWMFLTIITATIFALFIPVRLQKWKAKRLVLEKVK